MNDGKRRKAWQEPMVWLMLGIPAATLVAGFYTLYLAQSSGPLDSVQASVQRVGKAQVSDSAADAAATRNDFRAELHIDRQNPHWQLKLSTVPERLASAPIDVFFVHANDASRDVRVRLLSGRGQMPASLRFTPQQIVLTDQAGTWRLVGRYHASGAISLTPALSTR
jgi:uncharacterized protein